MFTDTEPIQMQSISLPNCIHRQAALADDKHSNAKLPERQYQPVSRRRSSLQLVVDTALNDITDGPKELHDIILCHLEVKVAEFPAAG